MKYKIHFWELNKHSTWLQLLLYKIIKDYVRYKIYAYRKVWHQAFHGKDYKISFSSRHLMETADFSEYSPRSMVQTFPAWPTF